MILEHDDYREFLKLELVRRIRANENYSLRSFARQMGLSPSTLSELMKGSKNLSLERAAEVASKLQLSGDEKDYFCLLVQKAGAKRPETRKELSERVLRMNGRRVSTDLSVELFAAISEWYHIPMLALADVKGFAYTPANIAKRFGIARVEAEVAIHRLVRLELLEKVSETRYRATQPNGIFRTDTANLALRHFHRRMLERASVSLDTQSNEEKFIGTRTFAIDAKQFPKAKKRIQQFLADMADLVDQGEKSEVYHLSVQLFNVRGDK